MPWVPWIDTEPEPAAREEVRKLYQKTLNTETGNVPDVVRLASLTPEIAGLIFDLNKAIHRNATGLTEREIEIVALIVSSYNGCVH